LHKKGQLSIDFYIALIVFLGSLAYITFQLFQIAPASSLNAKEETVKIEAYQISELLVNDGGHPNDWETKPLSGIKRIGLLDTSVNLTNFLSSPKIDRFKTICSNFNDVKVLLDVKDETSFSIIEHRTTGDTIDICNPVAVAGKKFSFNVSRTVFISGTSYPTEIIVEVWRK